VTKIVLQDLASLTNETAALASINSNNAIIETASDSFLSRDGTTPNQMNADLDMNSNQILNLPEPTQASEPLRLQDLSDFLGTGTISTGIPASEFLSLKSSFNAVGNGIVDDTSKISAANAVSGSKFSPNGTYITTLAATALDGPYWGPGVIRTGATDKRGSWFSAVKSNQSYTASNENSIDTAFTGTFTKCQFPVEHRITGTTTLTQPSSGYVYSPWAYPHYTYMFNSSGHNQSTSTNDGRTAACAYRTIVFNAGQGDGVCYNAQGIYTGTKVGATSFLASPNITLYNGTVFAGAAGGFLNGCEFDLDDQGNDCAGLGFNTNLKRSSAVGSLGAFWAGYRSQSIGSADINAHYSAVGKCDVGLDFSNITTDATKASIAIKADDRIYFDTSSSNGFYATTFNNNYLTYASGLTAFNFVVNNTSIFQIYSTQVVATTSLKSVSPTGGVGYAAGAGGTVTQATSKSTAVTLNKVTGQITTNNAALGAGGIVAFLVNNSNVVSGDTVTVNYVSGGADGGNYRLIAYAVSGGSFIIQITNQSGGSLSEAIVIGFNIHKGATS
jgi:hypothetical protein